ncbi:hypothetical protein [Flexivirga alba]|uniref:HIT domain-containing protein n=1 Tax=Flexivirga alba TaxID=702742 RepID=A0ABW2ACY6_9MICO
MPISIKRSGWPCGTLGDMDTTRTATHPRTTAVLDRDCWFCNDEQRTDPPPGGWLLDDGIWRAGAAPARMAAAGTVLLEAKRHVLDHADFDIRESITFIPAMTEILTAMRTALGCDRVYQWSTMASYEHFHVWLIPWWRTSAHTGPAHLVDVVSSPATEADVRATAARVAAALRVRS